MPFCPKCGAEYQEGTKFCAKCGGNLDGSVAPVPVVNKQPGFIEKLLNTKDSTDTMNAADITANKAVAIIAYCAPAAYILLNWFTYSFFALLAAAAVFVAPCILAKKSQFVRYHLGQSLTVMFAVLLVSIIDGAVTSFLYGLIVGAAYNAILYSAAAVTGAVVIATIIAWVLHLVFMAIPALLLVFGIVETSKGKAKGLPIIGKIGFTFDK